jgi:hypothetical protein
VALAELQALRDLVELLTLLVAHTGRVGDGGQLLVRRSAILLVIRTPVTSIVAVYEEAQNVRVCHVECLPTVGEDSPRVLVEG